MWLLRQRKEGEVKYGTTLESLRYFETNGKVKCSLPHILTPCTHLHVPSIDGKVDRARQDKAIGKHHQHKKDTIVGVDRVDESLAFVYTTELCLSSS